ncbi:DUF397 domain-containing protein [Saccharopolyspora sp. SCSIO 74807]|uniref:DUF397 domain-containing protein n=1 Tax=Saccharopolyspora sp. SCSIO 74807 TaxID=3118084 RepID=UPI0030D14968
MSNCQRWRKSSRSQQGSDCVELSDDLRYLRDSKDPDGATLRVDVGAFVAAVKRGRFDRK